MAIDVNKKLLVLEVGGTLQQKTVTPSASAQEITPDTGYNALSKVTVNATPLETKTVIENGTVTPTSPNIGLSSVVVNVPEQKPEQSKSVTITENGTSNVTPDTGKVLSGVSVVVNVPEQKPEEVGSGSALASAPVTVNPTAGSVFSSFTINQVTQNDGQGQSQLVASTIKEGYTVAGVTGTLKQGAPIEVATAAGMNSVLISANVGKVYKFVGTTDTTYTQNELYEVVSE